MNRPRSVKPHAAPSRRLALLGGLLALAAGALAAQRLWLSPEARERRLARMSLAELEQAAGAGRRDPLLQYALGRRREDAGDLDGAAEALERALELDPALARARAALGRLRLLQGRDQEGGQLLELAVRQDPRDPDAWLS